MRQPTDTAVPKLTASERRLPFPSALAGWKPFKSRGGPPPSPSAIGRVPTGPNPRFPQVGPEKLTPPPGGYQSVINTAPPLDEAEYSRAIAPHIFDAAPNAPPSAGSNSTSAFARALTGSTQAALMNSIAEYQQEFAAQSQKSLAEDLLSQRQSGMDLFRLLIGNAIYGADTFTRYDQGVKDLAQYRFTELWNEEAKRTAMVLRFVGSLI